MAETTGYRNQGAVLETTKLRPDTIPGIGMSSVTNERQTWRRPRPHLTGFTG
jgi:hypothetical protein